MLISQVILFVSSMDRDGSCNPQCALVLHRRLDYRCSCRDRNNNGVGHLIGTLYTGSYSPGVATGLGLWVPLGIWTLVRTSPLLSAPQLWIGVSAGVVIQGIVSLLVMMLGRHTEK